MGAFIVSSPLELKIQVRIYLSATRIIYKQDKNIYLKLFEVVDLGLKLSFSY